MVVSESVVQHCLHCDRVFPTLTKLNAHNKVAHDPEFAKKRLAGIVAAKERRKNEKEARQKQIQDKKDHQRARQREYQRNKYWEKKKNGVKFKKNSVVTNYTVTVPILVKKELSLIEQIKNLQAAVSRLEKWVGMPQP